MRKTSSYTATCLVILATQSGCLQVENGVENGVESVAAPAPGNPVAEGNGTNANDAAPSENLETAPRSGRRATFQDAEEIEMLRLINEHRATHGVGPLKIQHELVTTARWHAADMATKSYLSHNDSLGRDPFERMDSFGFPAGSYRGENIACGNGGAARTFKQWLHSRGHNANMLSPRYNRIGIARSYDADSRFGWYWATDFGRE